MCLQPGCTNFNWPNEVLLDEHYRNEHILVKTPFEPELATPASASFSFGSVQHLSSTANAVTTHFDFVPCIPSDSKSPPSTLPPKPFACHHESCQSSFERKGDLTRHLKNHRDGPRDFSCWADRCNRNGNNGFTRLDKLKEHVTSRHLLTDFHIYIKETNGYAYSKGGSHRFLSWRKARQDWQTENPSDEMPPWLTGESLWIYALWWKCPECQSAFSTPWRNNRLREHWQDEHPSLKMPLWMTKRPEWF